MQQTEFSTHRESASDGHPLPVYLWTPAAEPRAVIQVFHGLGEHSARYQRFAAAATNRGYVVGVHDHRGHGPEAAQRGFFAARNGWDLVVNDGHTITEFLRERFPDQPIVLLGHSMGSYIAQAYARRFGGQLAAMILSGSTWPAGVLLFFGRLLARVAAWQNGVEACSPLLNKIGFEDFNNQFEPARTELDWLSRDPVEVDAYIADPLCGGPYTTGLWSDLLGGLRDIASNRALREIPADLPILITGGADDPVGGERGMRKLSERYEATGHRRLATKIYPGGRHEMLNETNRDEFTADLLSWIENALRDHQV